jgi:hypothetical protein
MKRGRKNDKKDDKQQSSLFGTFLPLKQKFKETGETLCDIDFSLEFKSDVLILNEDKKIKKQNEFELLEQKYFSGFNLQGQEQAKQKIHDCPNRNRPFCDASVRGETPAPEQL